MSLFSDLMAAAVLRRCSGHASKGARVSAAMSRFESLRHRSLVSNPEGGWSIVHQWLLTGTQRGWKKEKWQNNMYNCFLGKLLVETTFVFSTRTKDWNYIRLSCVCVCACKGKNINSTYIYKILGFFRFLISKNTPISPVPNHTFVAWTKTLVQDAKVPAFGPPGEEITRMTHGVLGQHPGMVIPWWFCGDVVKTTLAIFTQPDFSKCSWKQALYLNKLKRGVGSAKPTRTKAQQSFEKRLSKPFITKIWIN